MVATLSFTPPLVQAAANITAKTDNDNIIFFIFE
jgi:hypothetical protein